MLLEVVTAGTVEGVNVLTAMTKMRGASGRDPRRRPRDRGVRAALLVTGSMRAALFGAFPHIQETLYWAPVLTSGLTQAGISDREWACCQGNAVPELGVDMIWLRSQIARG